MKNTSEGTAGGTEAVLLIDILILGAKVIHPLKDDIEVVQRLQDDECTRSIEVGVFQGLQ